MSKKQTDGQGTEPLSWEEQLDRREADRMARAYDSTRKELSLEFSEHHEADARRELKRLLADMPWRELSVEEGAEYQMEGEAGLWSFKTYRIVEGSRRRVIYDTRKKLPTQQGTRRLRTSGARELMLFLGPAIRSNRESTEMLSRIRHQDRAVALMTLRDFVEKEGTDVAVSLERVVEAEMAKKPVPLVLPQSLPQITGKEIKSAFDEAEVPDELRKEVSVNPVPYTPPEATTNIAADAVFCKKQKTQRGEEGAKEKTKERKTVSICCATVAIPGKRIVLATVDYCKLLLAVLATLRINGLTNMHVCLLTDGERKLRDVFWPALSVAVSSLQHVLDWHHLSRRCGQQLSMALKGKVIRNGHFKRLQRLLWFGCTDSAIGLIGTIPAEDVKNSKPLEELQEYLKNRRDQIPVYAVRKVLGLANSSNPVEKANDRLVSSRQKGKGMSWSQEGSLALANLRMLRCNQQQKLWLTERDVSLQLQPCAA